MAGQPGSYGISGGGGGSGGLANRLGGHRCAQSPGTSSVQLNDGPLVIGSVTLMLGSMLFVGPGQNHVPFVGKNVLIFRPLWCGDRATDEPTPEGVEAELAPGDAADAPNVCVVARVIAQAIDVMKTLRTLFIVARPLIRGILVGIIAWSFRFSQRVN